MNADLHFPPEESRRTIVDGLDHCEGVAYDPVHDCLWGGGERGQIYRIPLDGGPAEQVAQAASWILALTVDGAGRVAFCTAGDEATISVWDGTAVRVACRATERTPLSFPNALAFGPDGTLWFTDSGTFGAHDGRVLALRPNGQLEVVTDKVARVSNGCAVDPAGTTLFVVESFGPSLWRVPLDGSAPSVMATFPGCVPDGVTLTDDGRLLVVSYRPDRLYLVEPSGEAAVIAQDPWGAWLNAPTNACFAGPNLDRLVVTSFGRWHMTEIDAGLRGAPLHAPTRWAIDLQEDGGLS